MLCYITCSVAIAKRSVKADISQLAPTHMFFLSSYIGEDNATWTHTQLLCLGQDVGLTVCWEPQQPHHRLGHTFQDLRRRGRGT